MSKNLSRFVKDPASFIRHKSSLETLPENLESFLTPNSQFFVCSSTGTPEIDPASYRLRVIGDAIDRPLELSLEEIRTLPSLALVCYLECAGNGRQLFEEVHGIRPHGNIQTMWNMGGVGNAVWEGVQLRTILSMAGVKPTAVDVNLKGLDRDAPEGGINRPIPVVKALHPDTLLAYRMNGEPLPPDHGFPLRAVVPGWIGSNSIKWLGTIAVSSKKVWVRRNTEMYVLYGPQWPPERYAPAAGGPITTQNIKSSLTLPFPARLSKGRHLLRGIARSPHARIKQVVWSADRGVTWADARLVPPLLAGAWARFEFEWQAPPGEHLLMTCATDEAGNTQPEEHPFNKEGYLFNQVYPHPVMVDAI